MFYASPVPKLTPEQWFEQVGELPPLIDRLAFDLHSEGAAVANAVAESVRTLERVGKTGRTQNGSRVTGRVQNACRDNARAWRNPELVEAKDSLAKASTPEPWSTSKTSNWVARLGGLPDYIQHVSHGIKRSSPEISTSEAIAKAIGIVKRWAAGGKNVDAGTRAAAAKAIAEWEALKAKNKAKSAVKEAALRKSVNRLLVVAGEIPQQSVFSKRYANRVGVMEGLAKSLRSGNDRAVETVAKSFGLEDAGLPDVREAVAGELSLTMTLMEALGYGSTPIRASDSKHKGRFHGMHGVERAARKKTAIKGPGVGWVTCPSCNSNTMGGANCASCGSSVPVTMGSGGASPDKIAEAGAPPPVMGAMASPVFTENLHPRAAHGQFASKGGPGAAAGGAAGQGQQPQAAALVTALQQADPQFTPVTQGQLNQDASSVGTSVTPQGASVAGEQLQSLGFANDASGVAQFQKDNGMPVTGQVDSVTAQTIASIYGGNARNAKSVMPDFTGLAGSGTKVRGLAPVGTPGARGRTTLGKTSAKSIMLGAEQVESDRPLVEAPGFTVATTWPVPSTGTNHATSPLGGDRQPGGDDMDFDELFDGSPPNLRPGEGTTVCATCVHFSPKAYFGQGGCMLYSTQVDRLEVCDDYTTLTPPDATLRVFEARLEEAVRGGVGFEIVRARAAVKVAREKVGGIGLPHPADEFLAEAIAWDRFTNPELYLEERAIPTDKRRELAKKGQALKSNSYPIETAGDLSNAIKAWGRSNDADKPALKRLLLKMARKLKVGQDTVDRIQALTVPA